MKAVPGVAILAAVLSIGACGKQEPAQHEEQSPPAESQPESADPTPFATVGRADDGTAWYRLSDGRTFTDPQEYESAVHELAEQSDLHSNELRINFDATIQRELDAALGASESQTEQSGSETGQALTMQFGNYFLSTGPLTSGQHVAGCIGTVSDLKYAVRLNRLSPSQPVFDMHFVKYHKNGLPCVGIYESIHYWVNSCWCSPWNSDQIKNALYSALIAAGVAAATAWTVAQAAAPVVLFAF